MYIFHVIILCTESTGQNTTANLRTGSGNPAEKTMVCDAALLMYVWCVGIHAHTRVHGDATFSHGCGSEYSGDAMYLQHGSKMPSFTDCNNAITKSWRYLRQGTHRANSVWSRTNGVCDHAEWSCCVRKQTTDLFCYYCLMHSFILSNKSLWYGVLC